MKKIYSFIFATVALFSLIPLAKADGEGSTTPQKGPDYYLNDPDPEKASVGYMKSISEPTTDGVYYITLESFATGKSVRIFDSTPADIVLVLDVSGSMAYDMGSDSGNSNARLNAMKNAVYTFIDNINDNDLYFVDQDGKPDKTKPRTKRLGNRIAIVAFSGPQYANTEATAANSIKLDTGFKTLGDNQSITDDTGYDYLKNTAVKGLSAGGGTYANFGMQAAYNRINALGDDRKLRTVVFFTDGDPGNGAYWEKTERADIGYYRPNYVNLLTNSGKENGEATWLTANETINYANEIKKKANEEKKIVSRVYTVSIINNASPYTNVYLGKTSSNWTGATKMASLSTANYNWETRYYLNPAWNSTNIWANGDGTALPTAQQKFAFTASNASQLEAIFDAIATDSGGGSEDLGEQAVTEVDVVSASFMMPPGTNTSSIKVYLEECYGKAEKTYIEDDETKTGEFLQFRDRRGPIVPPNSLSGYTYDDDGDPATAEVPADRNISVSFEKSGTDPNNPDKEDMIVVNGFDYGKNWCGPKYDETGSTIIGWHGYKLVVVIPIMMDTNAVGGPDVSTNAEGSGIIVKGKNIAPFISPQVSLPVNIHIRKEGLDVGESAKFTIQRKYVKDSDAPAGTTNNWTDVSSVFVTRHQGQEETGKNAPVTKIMGMPSVDDNDKAFVYRVVEDNWNWSGRLVSIKDYSDRTIGNVATRSATTDEIEINPFIFVNEEINNIDVNVRHAESKATNIFKTGETLNPGYDDSKNNNRDVIVVSNSSSNQP